MRATRGHESAFRSTPLVVAALVSIVALTGFWELAEDFSHSAQVIGFDARVSAAVQSLRGPVLTPVVRAVTTTGDTVVVAAITIAIFAMLWRRRHDFAVFAAVAVSGGAVLSAVLKDRVGRVRPPIGNMLITLPASLSFPSGHAMASLCIAVIGSYLAVRSRMHPATKVAIVAALALWAVLVGLSRVYLGVHWPSDVLASWLLGAAWLSAVIGIAEARRGTRRSS